MAIVATPAQLFFFHGCPGSFFFDMAQSLHPQQASLRRSPVEVDASPDLRPPLAAALEHILGRELGLGGCGWEGGAKKRCRARGRFRAKGGFGTRKRKRRGKCTARYERAGAGGIRGRRWERYALKRFALRLSPSINQIIPRSWAIDPSSASATTTNSSGASLRVLDENKNHPLCCKPGLKGLGWHGKVLGGECMQTRWRGGGRRVARPRV